MRSKWFMESNYANKQTLNKPANEKSDVFGETSSSEEVTDW